LLLALHLKLVLAIDDEQKKTLLLYWKMQLLLLLLLLLQLAMGDEMRTVVSCCPFEQSLENTRPRSRHPS
jgi:hypothetical protein